MYQPEGRQQAFDLVGLRHRGIRGEGECDLVHADEPGHRY
jgi:hypothetical protein